jgi:hypothetical protein
MQLIAFLPVALSSSMRYVLHHLNTERETAAAATKATAMVEMATGNAGAAQNNSVCACFGQ